MNVETISPIRCLPPGLVAITGDERTGKTVAVPAFGTTGRALFVTNRDRGFQLTDNYLADSVAVPEPTALTLLGVVLAEIFVSQGGIGFYTLAYSETFNPAALMALVLTLALMAIALNELVRLVEGRFSRWKE